MRRSEKHKLRLLLRRDQTHSTILLPTETMGVLSKLEYSIIQRSLIACRKNVIVNSTGLRWKHSGICTAPPNIAQQVSCSKNEIHVTSAQEYPAATTLDLPSNVEDIASAEKSRFSPQRNRDISGSFISSLSSANVEAKTQKSASSSDARVASYDCTGAVSLSSAMQTNVPEPFKGKGKNTHLNMPGGQWGQGEKYMSEELNNSHHVNTRGSGSIGIGSSIPDIKKNTRSFMSGPMHFKYGPSDLCVKSMSTSNTEQPSSDVKHLTRKEKLKAAVRDYGSVVIVFHVGISLISLGACYLAITSGIDLSEFVAMFGSSEGAAAAGTAAPFIVAYAVHKTMAPVRISITLISVPFLVKYLRKIGLLKFPKKN